MSDLVNVEAEQSVIGSILNRPDSVAEVIDWLRPEMFGDKRARMVYTAIVNLWEKRTPALPLTITEELVAMGAKSESNVALYLSDCRLMGPGLIYTTHFGEIVREKAERRAIEAAGAELVKAAYGDAMPNTDDLIVGARRSIESFQRRRVLPPTQEEQITELRELSESIWSGTHVDRVVATGIRELDRMTAGGIRPGEVWVVGAKQSMGKTATSLHIAKQNAWVYFSLEMSGVAINRRLVATEAGVPYDVAMAPVCDQRLRDDWIDASYRVATWPMTIIAEQGMTTMRMEAMVERLREDHDVCGVMIDHIGYIADQFRHNNAYEKASEIARRTKQMAGKLDLPVIALQQLSRDVEKRSNYVPTMGDLRDSGKLAEDADLVALLFRRNYYAAKGLVEPDNDQDYVKIGDRWDFEKLQVRVEKNRNGETGTVVLGWEGKAMRLHEVAA